MKMGAYGVVETDAAIAVHAALTASHGVTGTIADLADIVTHAADFELHTKLVLKTADQTVNDSDTLVDDDELLFTVGANEIWDIFLYMRHISSTVADFDYAISVPAGAVCTYTRYYTQTPYDETDATAEIEVDGDGSEAAVSVKLLYIGGAAAGDVQLQWAQHTAEATNTKVLANSFIVATKIA